MDNKSECFTVFFLCPTSLYPNGTRYRTVWSSSGHGRERRWKKVCSVRSGSRGTAIPLAKSQRYSFIIHAVTPGRNSLVIRASRRFLFLSFLRNLPKEIPDFVSRARRAHPRLSPACKCNERAHGQGTARFQIDFPKTDLPRDPLTGVIRSK